MAQSGYTPISFYYSSVSGHTPTAGNLVNGELAINIADGVIYYKNGGGTVSPLGFGGTGLTWQAVQVADFTAAAGNGYPVDTSGGVVTVTLPASPVAGNIVTFTDDSGNFATNNLTINPNGNKLLASTDSVVMQTNRESLSFVYIDSTQGWLPYDGYNSSIPPSALYLLYASLRFRASNTAYLNRTPSVASNRQIYTISAWVKRGLVSTGAFYNIYAAGTGTGNDDGLFFDIAGGALYFSLTADTDSLITSGVFIDPAAWYHIVCAVDTTQATASNRVKIYVNGVQQTLVTNTGSGYPAQNTNSTYINTTNQQRIGAHTNAGYYFDGYMAEYNFIDGQALTPSSFGTTSTTTGSWIPIQYTGTYGTNGYYLKFTDTSSVAALGTDYSGNGNTWTVNNVSLTSGSTYDSMTDVPTLTDANTANYWTLNPLYPSSDSVFNGNLSISTTGAGGGFFPIPQNVKFYFEVSMTSNYGVYFQNYNSSTTYLQITEGFDNIAFPNAYYYRQTASNGATIDTTNPGGDQFRNGIFGLAVDMIAGFIYIYFNNTLIGTCTLNTAVNSIDTCLIANQTGTIPHTQKDLTFGQQPFTYTPPAGFLPLNTYNIAAGTVTTSGTFTGNALADGPFVYLNGIPQSLTINGNAVTFGTHANRTANGFKVITSSASYNASGSNTYTVTTAGNVFKNADAQGNP